MKLNMKKALIGLAIASVAVIGTGAAYAASSLPFNDIEGKWYQDTVAKAFDRGLVHGVGEGKYDGDGLLTRGEAASLANNIYDVEETKIAALEAEIEALKAKVNGTTTPTNVSTPPDDSTTRPAPTTTNGGTVTAPTSLPHVTLANYDKIVVGTTTKAEVESLFGTRGTVQYSSNFDNSVSEMIDYSAGGYDSATISYENGVVDYKSQVGLK